MRGWHYTSYRNWMSIQKQGFQAYPISKPGLDKYFPDTNIRGVWAWGRRPSGKSELGNLLFQTSIRQSYHIVLLEFDYDPKDLLHFKGSLVEMVHDGFIGSWLYHEDEPAYVVLKNIPPQNVRLVKHFNLMDIVSKEDHAKIN